MGSEMCIRDRVGVSRPDWWRVHDARLSRWWRVNDARISRWWRVHDARLSRDRSRLEHATVRAPLRVARRRERGRHRGALRHRARELLSLRQSRHFTFVVVVCRVVRAQMRRPRRPRRRARLNSNARDVNRRTTTEGGPKMAL